MNIFFHKVYISEALNNFNFINIFQLKKTVALTLTFSQAMWKNSFMDEKCDYNRSINQQNCWG